jgi:uncharacterized membrane protein YqjE
MDNKAWLKKEILFFKLTSLFVLVGCMLTLAGLGIVAISFYPDNKLWILSALMCLAVVAEIGYLAMGYKYTINLAEKTLRLMNNV